MSGGDAAADVDAQSMESVLIEAGQEHLLEGLEGEGRSRLLAQALQLDRAYSGGLRAYVSNARKLLQASQRGDNPFDGCTPSVPSGERLTYGDARCQSFEARGIAEARSAAFVLVAGGLGERLGFSGIKLALPATVVTGWTFLEYYCRSILALQNPSASSSAPGHIAEEPSCGAIPLVIMTSDDTHVQTLELLESHSYFGLSKDQVHVLKQEKVACLMDSDARLAKDPKDPCQLETKPHGHGDVHGLLHSSGLAKLFLDQGRRWLIFLQDTNGLFFRALLPTLGVSAELGLDMNSVAVPRRPKDAMGAITRLERKDGSSITINVEYNQLDPLLRSTVCPEGDAADATGWSPYPGNMNSLVLRLAGYVPTLERTGGAIAEFVNPKYTDASKTKFKSSTRLECMMQDLPLELPAEAKVGFTMLDSWVAYSPVKNDPVAAKDKFVSGNHPQSGTTGETDLFVANCRTLRMLGVRIEEAREACFNGIKVDLEARVIFSPSWATGLVGARSRLAAGSKITISQRSTLVLDGDIELEELSLDGALVITARPGCRVRIARLSVVNDGWTLEPTSPDEPDEVTRIRGFRVIRHATRELMFEVPGEHVVDESRCQIGCQIG